jgi:ceramide synthetase
MTNQQRFVIGYINLLVWLLLKYIVFDLRPIMSIRNYDIEISQTVVLVWIISTVLISFKNIVVYKVTNKLFEGRSNYTHQKASMSIYKIFSYLFIAFYGLLTLRNEDWIMDTSSYFNPFGSGPLPLKISFYYIYEFVFYLLEFIFLLIHYDFKDRNQMMIHHIVTLMLIGCSGLLGYIRYGVVIMVIHDVSDPFLETAKMFNYLKWKRLANFVFIIFSIVFFVSRLIILPCGVTYSVFLRMKEYNYCFEGVLFFILLSILELLHLVWFAMILKVISKMFVEHEITDIRSNSNVLDKTRTD